jgi:hypothetical protein
MRSRSLISTAVAVALALSWAAQSVAQTDVRSLFEQAEREARVGDARAQPERSFGHLPDRGGGVRLHLRDPAAGVVIGAGGGATG